MADEVLLFKLVNGTDCIGKLKSEDEWSVLLSKVRTLQYQQVGQEIRIGFIHFWLPSEDADVALPKEHIMVHMVAPSKIAEGYMQATSPIQLAKTIPQGRIIDGHLN